MVASQFDMTVPPATFKTLQLLNLLCTVRLYEQLNAYGRISPQSKDDD